MSESKRIGKLCLVCGAALQNMNSGMSPSRRTEIVKRPNFPAVERPENQGQKIVLKLEQWFSTISFDVS